jgi:hypothetical protein
VLSENVLRREKSIYFIDGAQAIQGAAEHKPMSVVSFGFVAPYESPLLFKYRSSETANPQFASDKVFNEIWSPRVELS